MAQHQPIARALDGQEAAKVAAPVPAPIPASMPADVGSPALLLQKRLEDAWLGTSIVPLGDDITMTRLQLFSVIGAVVASWAAIGVGVSAWLAFG